MKKSQGNLSESEKKEIEEFLIRGGVAEQEYRDAIIKRLDKLGEKYTGTTKQIREIIDQFFAEELDSNILNYFIGE